MKLFRFKRKNKALDEESDLEDQQFISRDQSSPSNQLSPEELSVSLRAEMLPSSEVAPDLRKFRFAGFNPRKLLAVLGMIILLGMGWFFYAGPGRPVLESLLFGLVKESQTNSVMTPTLANETEIVVVPTKTVQVVSTSTRTPLPQPSATAIASLDTPTVEPSSTTASDCVDVLTVTLEDLGKTLCVRGIIENFEARPSGFLIAFSNEPGSMYWVSYDLVWEPAKKGLCVELTGEVMQIADSPVIVFGYANLPQICPSP